MVKFKKLSLLKLVKIKYWVLRKDLQLFLQISVSEVVGYMTYIHSQNYKAKKVFEEFSNLKKGTHFFS